MLSVWVQQFLDVCRASHIPIEDLPQQFLAEQDRSAERHAALDQKYYQLENTFKTTILTKWANLGEIPRASLRPLLELVDKYFSLRSKEIDVNSFLTSLTEWLVHDAPIDDVKNLYAQVICVNDQSIHLIEILGNCFSGTNMNLDAEMKGIARWLCSYDASLIGEAEQLYELYAELKIGPAFGIDELQTILAELREESDVKVVNDNIDKLLYQLKAKKREQLTAKNQVDSDIMRSVYEIFRLRWNQILQAENQHSNKLKRSSPVSYLDAPEGPNTRWFLFAKIVCGAGWLGCLREEINPKANSEHFKNNYLRLLMPTIESDSDGIKFNCIAEHPIEDLLLAQKATHLINLNNSVARQKFLNVSTFYNYDAPNGATHFTEKELIRFERRIKTNPNVAKKFGSYLEQAKLDSQMANRPISKVTVYKLVDLVEKSTFTDALQIGQNYTDDQMDDAEAAYLPFYNYLRDLARDNKDERERLGQQPIVLGQQETTFDIIWKNLREDTDDACVPSCNRLFISLILSYQNVKFSSEIETMIQMYQMRESIETRIFREYEHIDDKEAKRRLLILTASIMTESFQPRSLYSTTVSLGDCSNIMVDKAHEIFKLINTVIGDRTFSLRKARRAYANIMELVVLPALDGTVANSSMQTWLQSIKDETLFQKADAWFRPEHLLLILAPMAQIASPISSKVKNFLDQLLRTYMQNLPLALKELRINILFKKMLQNLDETSRLRLLEKVLSNTEVTESQFIQIYMNYLIQCLVIKAVTASESWLSLFFKPVLDERVSASSMASISQMLSKSKPTDELKLVLDDLAKKISTMDNKHCGPAGKAAMLRYLKELQTPIKNIARLDASKRVPMSPAPLDTAFHFFPLPSCVNKPEQSSCGSERVDSGSPALVYLV
jgi:hypothetical protein